MPNAVWSVRFLVSTTRSSPSQRARVAEIHRDLVAHVRAVVDREDPRVGKHLVGEGDDAGPLDDAVAVAVDHAEDRAADAAGDAALVGREVEPRIDRAGAVRAARHGPGSRHDGRHQAARRIDEQTGLRKRAARVVVPERAGGCRIAADRLVGDLLSPSLHLSVGAIHRRGTCRRSARCRSTAASSSAAARGDADAFHVVARPDALKIRVAPRRARRGVVVGFSAEGGDDHWRGRAVRPRECLRPLLLPRDGSARVNRERDHRCQNAQPAELTHDALLDCSCRQETGRILGPFAGPFKESEKGKR